MEQHMGTVKRVSAVFLAATAVVVFFNLIFTPVYHDGSDNYALWKIVNWFMAAAVLVALVVNVQLMRALNAKEASTLDYVRTTVAFYATIVLAMLFFWSWFWVLNPSSETGNAAAAHTFYFPIMDALFIVIALSTGRHLWESAEPAEA